MDKNKKKGDELGIMASRKAANRFLRAGRRNENARKGGYHQHDRFRNMSDEEFDEGVRNGTITPEQIRNAGEYAWDTWMGDVWMEDADNDDKPEPTYDEFIADPAKYGYKEYPEDDMPNRMYRYNPSHYESLVPPERQPADNTAVAKKPIPQQ